MRTGAGAARPNYGGREEEMDAETHVIRKRRRYSTSEKRLLSADRVDWIRKEEKAVKITDAVGRDYPG